MNGVSCIVIHRDLLLYNTYFSVENMNLPGLVTRRSTNKTEPNTFPCEKIQHDLATAVLVLVENKPGGPTSRNRFIAHHASVLFGLARARARFKARLNEDPDEDRPAKIPLEMCWPSLMEGARAMYFTLDAVTRVSHTKAYTLLKNRQKYHEQVLLLENAPKQFLRRETIGDFGPKSETAARLNTEFNSKRMTYIISERKGKDQREESVEPGLLAHMEDVYKTVNFTTKTTTISQFVRDLHGGGEPPYEVRNAAIPRDNDSFWIAFKTEEGSD